MRISPKTMEQETKDLLRCWTDERLIDVRRSELGTINDIRIVTTDTQRYVLRIYKHRERERLELEHKVVRWVHGRGIPAVQPIPLASGETFLFHDGRLVTLLPFVDGQQPSRSELSRNKIKEMGKFLGCLHGILSKCPIENIPARKIDLDRERIITEIDVLLTHIRSIDRKTDTDNYSLAGLQSRRDWLACQPSEMSMLTNIEGSHPLHGDYQETNVFFKDDRICGVIDWDRIYAAPPAWEIMRTMDLMLRFDPAGCRTFLDGYKSEQPLTMDKLDEAAKMYGLMRAYDLWLPKEIYQVGNDRVRRFVGPGHFNLIEEQWGRLSVHLDVR